MENLKYTTYRLMPILFIFTLIGCVDETEQVTPLSTNSLVLIPSESSEAEILESSSEGFTVPIVLSSALTEQGSLQVQFSSSDGTAYGTDYITTPEADAEGIVTLSLASGSTQTSLTVNPVLDPAFNPNKVVNASISSAGSGLVLGELKDFSLTIVNKPIIEVSSTSLAFGANESGSLPVKSYTVTGFGLLGDIEISSETGFLVSLDNDIYAESVTIGSAAAEQMPVTIFVQFNADTGTLGEKLGTIALSSASADDVSVSASGKEVQFSDFASAGFEDVDLTGRSVEYTRNGTVPDLINNAGEAPVDFTATGSELGFDTAYDPDDFADGDDSTEPIGVGAVTDLFDLNDDVGNIPFSYQEGTQGYHASDIDGTIEIVFDEVTFAAGVQHVEFSMSVFLYSFEGNFDAEEGVELVWRTATEDLPLIDVEDAGGTGDFTVNGGVSVSMEEWNTLKAALDVADAGTTGRLVVRIFNDNNDDIYIVDDINIRVSE